MLYRILAVSLMIASLSGCATMMEGQKQLAVTSAPTGAAIYLNGVAQWTTPAVIALNDSQPRVLRVELDGYQPYEVLLERKISGWFWANILFNYGLGMAIDAITGEMYRLTPDQVVAQLRRSGVTAEKHPDGVQLFVVLEPDTAWERAGAAGR